MMRVDVNKRLSLKQQQGGYIAYIKQIPATNTQGETREDTKATTKMVSNFLFTQNAVRMIQESQLAEECLRGNSIGVDSAFVGRNDATDAPAGYHSRVHKNFL